MPRKLHLAQPSAIASDKIISEDLNLQTGTSYALVSVDSRPLQLYTPRIYRGDYMSAWPAPKGTRGDSSLIRTKLEWARQDPDRCQLAAACSMRPLLEAERPPPSSRKQYQDFTLGPLMAALNEVEYLERATADVITELWRTKGRFQTSEPPAHPAVLRWTQDAFERYLVARQEDQRRQAAASEPLTEPVQEAWSAHHSWSLADARGVTSIEQTAWGRGYANPSDTHRDLWLISFGSAKLDRPEAEKAAAANAVCFGHLSPRAGMKKDWPEKYKEYKRSGGMAPAPAKRVRILDFGCTDGISQLLADWPADEVTRQFAIHTKPLFDQSIMGLDTQAGSNCLGCKAMTGCSTLVRTPDLLPMINEYVPKRQRSFSMSDLRASKDCGAKYLLTRQLHFKSRAVESTAIRRGRAIDAWLNRGHQRGEGAGCRSPIDVIELQNLTPRLGLTLEETDDCLAMLRQHAAVCPISGLAPEETVLVQPMRACYIDEFGLLVLAKADLLHSRSGGWVWRETKTSGRDLFEGRSLMVQYPQLALAILMINSGVLGGDIRRSRVELELLTVNDVVLEELDPSQSHVVDEARLVIGDLVLPWLNDIAYQPRPGYACATCEALEWCAEGKQHLQGDSAKALHDLR